MSMQRQIQVELRYVGSPLIDMMRIKVPIGFSINDIAVIFEKQHKQKNLFLAGAIYFVYGGKVLDSSLTLETLFKMYKLTHSPNHELVLFVNHSASKEKQGIYAQEESVLQAYHLEKDIEFLQNYQQQLNNLIPKKETPEYQILTRDSMSPNLVSVFPYMNQEISSFLFFHQEKIDEFHKFAFNQINHLVNDDPSANINPQNNGNNNNDQNPRPQNQQRRNFRYDHLIRGGTQFIFILMFSFHFFSVLDLQKMLYIVAIFFTMKLINQQEDLFKKATAEEQRVVEERQKEIIQAAGSYKLTSSIAMIIEIIICCFFSLFPSWTVGGYTFSFYRNLKFFEFMKSIFPPIIVPEGQPEVKKETVLPNKNIGKKVEETKINADASDQDWISDESETENQV